MGRVYKQADAVWIWLGDEDEVEDAEEGRKCVRELLELKPRYQELLSWKTDNMNINEIEGLETRSNFVRDVAKINQHFGIQPVDSPGFRALRELLQRPWFYRAWTFQEAFLAKRRNVVWGSECIDGRSLWSVIYILMILSMKAVDVRYFNSNLRKLYGMLEGDSLWKDPKDMLDLLGFRRGAGHTLPSDLVYSLLGCVQDGPDIQVDYSKPFETVFTELALHSIRKSWSLFVLGQVDVTASGTSSSLPSWVPDWRFQESHQWYSARTPRYRCTGSAELRIHASADKRELHLDGIEFGRVVAVTPGDNRDLQTWLVERASLDVYGRYRPTREDLSVVELRTRCADIDIFGDGTSHVQDGRLPADADERLRSLASEAGSAYTAALVKLVAAAPRTSFFATGDGRVGQAPTSVREGDVVCLVFGGEVPLLLRPRADGETYHFVGEGYLHGYMDGQGIAVQLLPFDPSDLAWLYEEWPSPPEVRRFCIKQPTLSWVRDRKGLVLRFSKLTCPTAAPFNPFAELLSTDNMKLHLGTPGCHGPRRP